MEFFDFKLKLLQHAEKRPSWSRKGQFIFNYIDEHYGSVARDVQFIDKVDCFYDDAEIEPFILKCWERIYK